MSADGLLTPTQHAIMKIIWEAGRRGITTAEVWRELSRSRKKVARTTVLNLVSRLEERGWLSRKDPKPGQKGSATRLVADVTQYRARLKQLVNFVDEYYAGSAFELSKTLLMFKCLSPSDMESLKQQLEKRLKECQ